MKTSRNRLGAMAIMALTSTLCAAMASSPCLFADILPVSSIADSGPDTLLPDTLRHALSIALDGDTIDATGVSGTILLMPGATSPAELVIDKSVTILGPGPASLTVDAGFLSRVFHITPGHTVTIAGLRIVHGDASPDFGGGILNDHSALTVNDCVLSDNAAAAGGGIFNGGRGPGGASLTVNDSLLSGNTANTGGGLFSDGSESGDAALTMNRCTLSGNSAFSGGGVTSNGTFSGDATLSVNACTVTGNVATFGDGGGIHSNGSVDGHAVVNVTASTISGNSAGNVGGGIINDSTELRIADSTFSGNTARLGGGIFIASGADPSSLVIGNTLFRAGALGENIFNDLGTVTSHGFNLSSDDGGGYLTATGDQVEIDPLLGPLQDNGGPTQTHLPLAGSPAIDRGLSNSIAVLASSTDQRGASRTIDDVNVPNAFLGDGTDIGAVELAAPNRPPVALCKDVTVLAAGGGQASASVDDGSFDPDSGDTISLVQDPAGPYPIGATPVTLTVTDDHGSSDSCTAMVTVVGIADLFISKAVVSGQAKPGQILTYTIVVSNLGPDPATGVVVTDPVPQGTTFASASSTPSSAPPVGAGGTVTWNLDELASGASVKLTLKVNVSLKGNTLIVNTATVGSNSFDPSLANNTATVTSKRNTK